MTIFKAKIFRHQHVSPTSIAPYYMAQFELWKGTQQANQAANYIRGSISGASEAGKRILNHASSQKSVIGFRPPSNMRTNPVYSRLQSVGFKLFSVNRSFRWFSK